MWERPPHQSIEMLSGLRTEQVGEIRWEQLMDRGTWVPHREVYVDPQDSRKFLDCHILKAVFYKEVFTQSDVHNESRSDPSR